VVIDAAQCAGYDVACCVEDDPAGNVVCDVPVEPNSDLLFRKVGPFQFVVAVGDNEFRRRSFERLIGLGGVPLTVVHPKAVVARSAKVGEGCVVAANAVINARAIIAENCIINTSATIDHDCSIDSHSHICPGCHLAGRVRVGRETMIGTGSVVVPGISIGERSRIGAGSLVIRDISAGARVYGRPAGPKEQHSR
jgi:sugar O-acyltransferase (sialic acid O-acetyltransferase NeuD family)